MRDHSDIKGRRVFVVEDEPLIAMLMEDMLSDLGCVVVGPAHTVSAAQALLAEKTPIDVALLDLNLAGEAADPIADALRDRGVPVIICTGSVGARLRDGDRPSRVLQKPYRSAELAAALAAALDLA